MGKVAEFQIKYFLITLSRPFSTYTNPLLFILFGIIITNHVLLESKGAKTNCTTQCIIIRTELVRNNSLKEGRGIQKPIPKPRKSLEHSHNSDITRFRINNKTHKRQGILSQAGFTTPRICLFYFRARAKMRFYVSLTRFRINLCIAAIRNVR